MEKAIVTINVHITSDLDKVSFKKEIQEACSDLEKVMLFDIQTMSPFEDNVNVVGANINFQIEE